MNKVLFCSYSKCFWTFFFGSLSATQYILQGFQSVNSYKHTSFNWLIISEIDFHLIALLSQGLSPLAIFIPKQNCQTQIYIWEWKYLWFLATRPQVVLCVCVFVCLFFLRLNLYFNSSKHKTWSKLKLVPKIHFQKIKVKQTHLILLCFEILKNPFSCLESKEYQWNMFHQRIC